ncbi:MAG: YicC family protein [Clostridiales bacterium]|nr:YicC family protein [Clostridiales bacterium]
MIKSMTGFGRCETTRDNRKLVIEMKSVNHRYLDVNIKMPKKLNFFEAAMRTVLKKYATRGKIDIFVTYEDYSENTTSLKYNADIASEYLKYFRTMEESFGIENDVSVTSLSKCPDVFVMEDQNIDEEKLWKLVEETLVGACEKFVESRKTEGENLRDDIIEKLENMLVSVDYIEERSPELLAEYRKKIEEKVKDLLSSSQIDDSRVAAEVVLYADKICVDEEIVRLRSHIEKMKQEIMDGGDIGRKLDFLAQEMNREANTVLSKTNDITTTNTGIDLKTEIEKVREQIQNIE